MTIDLDFFFSDLTKLTAKRAEFGDTGSIPKQKTFQTAFTRLVTYVIFNQISKRL